ncbi:hypothetical protein [Bifidobacterium angulatum]|uniref:hypothetical protein n=1 Tax=Bifidobacterium angulatum TaxID=1683 RepID=UPI0026587219|nr:hypothetical protein [Bifidobacterium angulatum]
MYGITIAADSGSVVTSALQLFSQFAIIGGGLWAVWGVITLAGGLKDQNTPVVVRARGSATDRPTPPCPTVRLLENLL